MYQIQVLARLNYFLMFPPGTGLIQYGTLIICQGIFSSVQLNHIRYNQVYTVILFSSDFNYIIYTVFNKHANQPYRN